MIPDRVAEMNRLFFESVPAMMWHVGPDGKVIMANQAALTAFGMKNDDVVGQSLTAIFPPDLSKIGRDVQKVVETGQVESGPAELLRSFGGTEKWVISCKVPRKDENGKVSAVEVFAVDVTDQKSQETRLKKLARSLDRANRIMRLESWLSRAIIEEDYIDVDDTIEEVGVKLGLNSVFMYQMEGTVAKRACGWETSGTREFPESISLGDLSPALSDWILEGKPTWGKPAKLPEPVHPLVTREIEQIVGTAVLVPMAFPDDTLCVMGFGTINGRYWSDEEIEALYGLGRMMALLVKSSHRNQDMMERMTNRFSEITSILNRVGLVNEYAE